MRTFRVNSKRLKGSKYASLIMRLAMVVNDISTASVLLDLATRHDKNPDLKNSDPMLKKMLGDKQLIKGFQMYAFRMVIGHFCEGMKIIEIFMKLEKAGDRELSYYLGRLRPDIAEHYKFLKNLWVKDSPDEKMFKRLMQPIRHSVAFHYEVNDDHITKTIASMADIGVGSLTSFMQGRDICTTRFNIADTVTLYAICDSMWGAVSKDQEETDAKIDESMKWCGQQRDRLYMVGYDLCGMYFSENSV